MKILRSAVPTFGVRFTRTRHTVVTLSLDGLRFWQPAVDTVNPVACLQARLDHLLVGQISLTPQDDLAATACEVLDLTPIWERLDKARHGEQVQAKVERSQASGQDKRPLLSGVCFPEDRPQLLSWDHRNLFVWERDEGWHNRKTWPWGGYELVAVSPDGKRVALGSSWLADIQLRCLETGEDLGTCQHPNGLLKAVFSHDGAYLATMTRHPSKVRLWEVASCKCLTEFKAFRTKATALAFHPSNRFLAAASDAGEVRLYDLYSCRKAASFHWGLPGLCDLAFARDGLTAAACGRGSGVVVWDLDDL